MASSTTKRRRSNSVLEELVAETPKSCASLTSIDGFEETTVNESQSPEPVKPLLPVRPKVPGREYITVKTRRADYWVHFLEYNEQGTRRAECLYCENKTFASDGNKNGSKNIRNHWLLCPANPDALINKSKGKQTELVFDRAANGGEGKLKGWTLNLEEVREAIVYMIIIDELPFRFVEKPGFARLMSVTCPSFKIPSRSTITRNCYRLYTSEKIKLKELLRVSSQRVSFTTDTWTSIQKVNYMCLTAHYIDNNWSYHKKILCFCPIYSHKGKDIANLLDSCFKAWGLEDKVFTVTVDNASSNDTACLELKKILQKKHNTVGNGDYLHMRCIAHIINLIVWDGLKKNKKSINRVRYAVKFVKGSPARVQFFKDVAKKYTKCELSLSVDVPTRWNSTYTMLETALNYKDVFADVNVPIIPIVDEPTDDLETLDAIDEFGNLVESEVDHSGAPSDYDWTVVQALAVFLKEFKQLTDEVSGSLYVTSDSSFFVIARALRQLNSWTDSKDDDLRLMSTAMKKKFDKYWGDITKMNVLIYMGAILDPHVKLVGLKFSFTTLYGSPKDEELSKKVYDKATILFDEYRRLYASQTDESIHNVGCSLEHDDSLDFKKAIERQVRMTRADGGYAKSEFDRYLNEVLGDHEQECKVLPWWRLNGHRYPVLARLARDVLAVPISTVASESTFSAGRRHLSPFRSSLTPKIVESLICTQDWIRPRDDDKLKLMLRSR